MDIPTPPILVPLSPAQQQLLALLKAVATGSFKLDITQLETAFNSSAGDWEATKVALAAANVPVDQINKLDLVHTLADVTGNNTNAVTVIFTLPGVNTIRDFALQYDATSLAASITPEMVPAGTAGATPQDQLVNYTKSIFNNVYVLQPSAVLQRMATTGKLAITDPTVNAGVVTFFANQPDFNISTTSVYTALQNTNVLNTIDEQSIGTVIGHLKTLQRVQAISRTPDTVAILMSANVISAQQVAEMAETSFMNKFTSTLGEDEARYVYYHATNVKLRNENYIRNIQEAVKGTGIGIIDSLNTLQTSTDTSNAAVATNLKQGNTNSIINMAIGANGPGGGTVNSQTTYKNTIDIFNTLAAEHGVPMSWEILFGPTDLCQCGDCNSVYSPAAYFVELLQYLRNNNLDKDPNFKVPSVQATGTVLEKFFSRRPDLGDLELSCANTNTILPYIDLVNEVLESFVVHLNFEEVTGYEHVIFKDTSVSIYNTEDETTGELLAQPQHTNYYAYPILAEAVYPFALPYNQAIDTIRIFLNYLGTSRYELMQTFMVSGVEGDTGGTVPPDPAPQPAPLNALTFQTAVDAEYLGLTENEYIILVKQDFWQKAVNRNVWECYGYDNDADMNNLNSTIHGLTFVKEQFLKRTGIQYTDLVSILQTNYINPSFPKGQTSTILKTILPFYTFVLAKVNDATIDPALKNNLIITWITVLKNPFVVNPGAPTDPDILQTGGFGQLVVLDSGDSPYFPIYGDLYDSSAPAPAPLLGTLNNDGTILDTNNNKVGDIDPNSKVVFTDPTFKKVEAFFIKNGTDIIGNIAFGSIISHSGGLNAITWQPPLDSCDLDKVRLVHLDGTALSSPEYDKIQRFIRLWLKMGWTIDETDKALTGLGNSAQPGNNNDSINPGFTRQLVSVKKLAATTGLELVKLLTFWSDISTAGDTSLYSRLFLSHNMIAIDPVFVADSSGDYLTITGIPISEHIPVIMAALNLKTNDITTIMGYASIPDALNISTISKLYRNSLLMKTLGVKSNELKQIITLFGDPFRDADNNPNADTTENFFDMWGKMEGAGFTYRQLNYIINNTDDPAMPLTPSVISMLQLAKTLYDGLNLIDADNTNIKDDSDATADFVSSKVSLLFSPDIAAQVMGLLLGTTVYSTGAPIKLVSNQIEFSNLISQSTLAPKLKYDFINGTIQVTGILTADENTTAKALFANPDWANAFDKIHDMPAPFYKDVLFTIFNDFPPSGLDAFTVLTQGDTNIPLSQQDQTKPPISSTAPQKLFCFINSFLPYLRKRLENKFLVDTLAAKAGIGTDVTETLISDVLTHPATTPLIEVFRNIKNQAQTNSPWTGYLVPNAEDNYSFIVPVGEQATLKINSRIIGFNADPNSNTIKATDFVKLKTGYAYYIETTGLSTDLSELQWKTATSKPAIIPPTVLYPDDSTNTVTTAFIQLQKAAMLVSGFILTATEVSYLQNNTDFERLDFNKFTLDHWKNIDAYTRFRNSLPKTDTSLVSFFTWINQAGIDSSQLSPNIAKLTLWPGPDISSLIVGPATYNLGINDFKNANNLLKLQQALYLADKLSVDISTLFKWAMLSSDFNSCRDIAEGIRKTIKARYTETDWEQVVQPLNDQLRENQRDALVSYLLVQPTLINEGVTDADGLFEFFLIDVQMGACMQTSRIKQAINSVQLFVQRCFLGLEEPAIPSDALDRSSWEWMQREVLWVANRKVFLYPENWIEESLRDDKSDFFKELESELLQKDINTQTIEDALKNYLYKVDEVANMRVIGLYIQDDPDYDNHKIHVFSRTRNAPYFFFYRNYDTHQKLWIPWEEVKVDIASHDVEDDSDDSLTKGKITDNGCYLIPVVFDNRLLIFLPQLMKKTVSVNNSNVIPTRADTTTGSVTVGQPSQMYEIKMAWSEYRNGKWTQKQVSSDCVYSSDISNINKFAFFSVIKDSVQIEIYHMEVSSEGSGNTSEMENIGVFEFQGNKLTLTGSSYRLAPDFINFPDSFQYFNNSIYSYLGTIENIPSYNGEVWIPQYFLKPLYDENSPHFTDNTNSVQIIANKNSSQDFYHPYTHQLLGSAETNDLIDFFECVPNGPDINLRTKPMGEVSDTDNMFGAYSGDSGGKPIYNELAAPYSIYNWELFFHAPMMLAGSLSRAQNFEPALKWYEYVFNPKCNGKNGSDFWRFWPFHHTNAKDYLENFFYSLQPNASSSQISTWRNTPFNPHAIARLRPSAYMKWTVMKYLDNLVAWGDYLFTQHTIESINQATQLYVLASHILGERPQVIPKRGTIKVETYNSLLDKWDAFGNAMVELEVIAPYLETAPLPAYVNNGAVGFANIYGTATTEYFCTPDNPNLTAYWDTIADRLYKIRHCENMEGVFGLPPLWDPPIDPGLLVLAEAEGLSIANVLNDMSRPLPNYRFNYLMQKSLELCGELKSMGNSLLSVFEKNDAEALANMRARHETNINNLVMQVKTMQVEEANAALDGLQQNLAGPKYRLLHYLKLLGADPSAVPADENTDFIEIPDQIEPPIDDTGLKLMSSEKDEMDKASDANDLQIQIGIVEAYASMLNMLPNLSLAATPIGVGSSISFGGSNLGAAYQATARAMQIFAGNLSYQSSNAQRIAGFTRQMQDRVLQGNIAGYEINNINRQIASQKIRIAIANQEIANQQQQIENFNEVMDFLTNKYTNEDLYSWMCDSIKALYYQVYTLAYGLAKKAEMVYRFDRGLQSSSFILFGYWNAGRDGLLAGEQLFLGLKQLEAAYQQERGYDFEITKHISLRQINPIALLELRQNASCEFEIPEILFDMDFPGHYMRRIKSVSLTIPCIVGPYTGVNATLRLTENTFRQKPIPTDTSQDDPNLITFNVPITAIAVGSAQNDSGVFELNFKEERYMPFEGAGAISRWRLELPAGFKQFDYNTITDVIIHMRYTSVDGGDKLKAAAVKALNVYIASTENLSQQEGLFSVFDLQHDFPNEWYNATKVPQPPGTTQRTIQLNNLKDRFPIFTGQSAITATDIYFLTSSNLQPPQPGISFISLNNTDVRSGYLPVNSFNCFALNNISMPLVNNWELDIWDINTTLVNLWMIVRYSFKF